MATHTPWGDADEAIKIAPGIMRYSTPSHGGYHLSAKKNSEVNVLWRRDDGWYEEDCEWAKVVLSFPNAFLKFWLDEGHDWKDGMEAAEQCAKSWYPDSYQTIFRCLLDPTESYWLREREKFPEDTRLAEWR